MCQWGGCNGCSRPWGSRHHQVSQSQTSPSFFVPIDKPLWGCKSWAELGSNRHQPESDHWTTWWRTCQTTTRWPSSFCQLPSLKKRRLWRKSPRRSGTSGRTPIGIETKFGTRRPNNNMVAPKDMGRMEGSSLRLWEAAPAWRHAAKDCALHTT